MKVIAKPFGLLPVHEITKEKIIATPTGQKVLAIVKECIEKKLIASSSVNDFIKNFCNLIHKGTCFGESSALLVSDHYMEKVSKIDVICHQMLRNLESFVGGAVSVKKDAKKIDAKIDKASKKKAKKLKKEKKIFKKAVEFIKDQYDLPVKMLKTQALSEAKLFKKKIHQLEVAALVDESGYSYKKQYQFSEKQKSKLLAKVTKLQGENKKVAVRVSFLPDDGLFGHAILLFPDARLEIYNSQEGLSKATTKKEYLHSIGKLFDRYIGKASGKVEFEVLMS